VARSVSRRRETAVRAAVGASASRLVRQWLTESMLLAMLGGWCGVLLARWGAPLLHLAGIPATVSLAVNVRVLLFSFAVAAAAGVLSGLAPILHTLREDTIAALRDEGGAVATGVRAARWRRAFVVFQVAVSLMLLVGAGWFLRTLRNAHAVALGYQIDSTMVADINLDVRGYSQEAGSAVYRQILDRLQSAPGVVSAGAARVTVLSGGARTVSISLDGLRIREDLTNNLDVRVNVISDGYLQSLGIPVLRGRDFTAADGAASMPVAIVSQSLAARLWPGQDPIGKPVGDGTSKNTVVGVVPDTVYRHALEREAPPFYYIPLAQNYEAGVGLHLRVAEGDPLSLLPAVRSAVHDVDPRIAVARPQRLREVFEQSIASQRMMATLVGAFGALALLLATVGVYGIMEHVAAQRRAEIGIRLALGAVPSSIFGLILGDGLKLVAIGTAIGLAAAFATTRYIQTLLFGVDPIDAATFAAVSVVLTAAAALACFMPARRAMRVDPGVALRAR
jgi:predicted permease